MAPWLILSVSLFLDCTVRTTDNKCCVFPFLYEGERQFTCVSSFFGGKWCATTYNYDEDEEWGECLGLFQSIFEQQNRGDEIKMYIRSYYLSSHRFSRSRHFHILSPQLMKLQVSNARQFALETDFVIIIVCPCIKFCYLAKYLCNKILLSVLAFYGHFRNRENWPLYVLITLRRIPTQ